MAGAELTLTDLANRGELEALENRWLDAIEGAAQDQPDLLEALAVLTRNDQRDQAVALAWTWLATEQERARPPELLALGRELLLRCGDNDEMRQEILRLYKEVFGDRPGIDRLIEVSGLGGGKTVLRALRTLEICLDLHPADCLISRSDERAAEVTAVDAEACAYTVRSARGEQTLDADQLALAYDPADPDDFRVLVQLHPDRLGERLEADPVAVVIGILRSHGGRLDSDELENLLVPRFIPADRWRKWWTRAKGDLRRCPNVGIEGKTRVILTYHTEGRSLEDEILPQWEAAGTSAERLSVIDMYFREARARQSEVKPVMVKRMHGDLLNRVNLFRSGSASEALAEALLIDRLAGGAELPDGGAAPARDIVNESRDLIGLLRGVKEAALYPLAIAHVKEAKPADWADIYARLLPVAPLEGCELIARVLAEAGHRDRLAEAVDRIPSDFTHHLGALCWLWRGPSIEGLDPMSPRELLLKLLEHLAELTIGETTSPQVLRDARHRIRAALSSSKYARYRAVIAGMEPGLAATVQRTIDRLDGLGQVVRNDLLGIILDTHPQLAVAAKAKIDPWTDDGVIFCTHEGRTKHEAELNHLINVKMSQNAKAIGEAASHGDLSDNAEYRSALEERDLLQARAARMQNELAIGRLLTANDISTDAVNIGTRVTIQAVDGADRHEITVLGPWEADVDKGVYNYRAPLCMKLKELRVGDVAALDLGGGEREYRVEEIANALTSKATG